MAAINSILEQSMHFNSLKIQPYSLFKIIECDNLADSGQDELNAMLVSNVQRKS